MIAVMIVAMIAATALLEVQAEVPTLVAIVGSLAPNSVSRQQHCSTGRSAACCYCCC